MLFSALQCMDNICNGNGACSETDNGYQCTCTPRYEGDNCQTGMIKNDLNQNRSKNLKSTTL